MTIRPLGAATTAPGVSLLRDTLDRCERALIEQALERAGGNRVQAARALGISRRWLQKKLERYAVCRETLPAGPEAPAIVGEAPD